MVEQASINSSTLWATCVLAIACLVVPRRQLLVPYMLAACFVPADQCIMAGGLHFYVLQILIIVGALRMWIRGEIESIKWNRFDKFVLTWAIVGTIMYTIQWMQIQALILRCGRLLQYLGLYWLFRQNIRSWRDMEHAYLVLAACAMVMVPFVAYEWATGSNPFSVFGRVATDIREGQYRCQASFPHAIILGLFWAVNVPMFAGFARHEKKRRLYFWSAVAASLFIVVATASSTPIMTLLIVVMLLFCYKYRASTRSFSWGLVGVLFALHMVMNAPVWHLISRVNIVSGSTGWHRYNLIDKAVEHFGDWVLVGYGYTGRWGYGLEDVTNEFIAEGVRGGLLTLILFVVMIYKALKVFLRESLGSRDRDHHFIYWCLFVTVLGHCVSFFGVTYFGQVLVLWYMVLPMAGAFYDKGLVARTWETGTTGERKAAVSRPSGQAVRLGGGWVEAG